jgi:hypothetical protein
VTPFARSYSPQSFYAANPKAATPTCHAAELLPKSNHVNQIPKISDTLSFLISSFLSVIGPDTNMSGRQLPSTAVVQVNQQR